MTRQFVLRTARSEYIVSLRPDGSGLVLDHWGIPLPGGVEPWDEPHLFALHRTIDDLAPLEYASAGQRQTAFSELLVDRGDGRTGARWAVEYDGVQVTHTAEGDRLDVPFVDERAELRLVLSTVTDSRTDVVRRWVTVHNLSSNRTIKLRRVFSAGWALPIGRSPRIHCLAGAWAQEFQPQQLELGIGTFSIGSRQGITGSAFAPTLTLEAADGGRAFGVALEWSGSWRLQAEATLIGDRVRVSGGVDDDLTTITLLPGERFEAPAALGVFSAVGAPGVTQAWHEYQRTVLARSLEPAVRPVIYNSWEATEFRVDAAHQYELATRAARIGVDAFVVDDGWFVGRTSDRSGLGDWHPDPAKFPDGFAAFAQSIVDLGLRFGLWVEPEAVNPDSDLYREHPDWVYRADDREPVLMRHQLVLDLGRAEVVEWIVATLRRLLTSTPISYLKWDMNRPITDGGRPGDPHGRQWSVQHTRGYYEILRVLRQEFPHVTIEACSSGGARIDNAVLGLADVVWTSDETGPRDRLAIQHGYLSAYPAFAMSSWVTDERGMRTRTPVSLEFRFLVAMCGVLGIGADLGHWSDEQLDRARFLVEVYRSIRHVVHGGRVVRHGVPEDAPYCVEFAGDDGTVCLFVFDRDRNRTTDRGLTRVRPSLLTPGVHYRIRGTDRVVAAAAAGELGIPVEFALAVDADLLILDPVSGSV